MKKYISTFTFWIVSFAILIVVSMLGASQTAQKKYPVALDIEDWNAILFVLDNAGSKKVTVLLDTTIRKDVVNQLRFQLNQPQKDSTKKK